MFDGPDDARRRLAEVFEGAQLEQVLSALVPAVAFEPVPATKGRVGGTRLGGAPDMPDDARWPRPPAPLDVEDIVRRGNAEAGEEMRRHFRLGLPYVFFAQIDLAEAAALRPIAADLPSEGRLLFFYDLAVGPWETGGRPVRVIWDTSAADRLKTLDMPADLAAEARRSAAELDAARADFPRRADEPAEEGSYYGAPARSMRLRPVLRLPALSALVLSALPAPDAALRGEAGGPSLADALGEAVERFGGASRQQLLGWPDAEQDDPRLDAVVVTEFGKQHLSSEEWATHKRRVFEHARDWRLLLQIDLGDWMRRRFVEGVVYVLIAKDALRDRRFDEAVAVYQQT